MTTNMKGKKGRQRRQKDAITIIYVENILRDYSSESSIHGIQYLANRKHSICGRAFWIMVVCMSLACTSYQVFNIWRQWVDDPVVTTLNTISLPVERIDFPAVTLCPQGSTEDIIDNFFYHQFEEWLLNQSDVESSNVRKKRLVEQNSLCDCHVLDQKNMTADVLQCCFRHFLDENFPGVFPNNPTKMATMLNAENPDRAMETKTIVIPDENPSCDANTNLDILKTMNQNLQRSCPEPFKSLNDSICFIKISSEMSYKDASSLCNEHGGAEIFSLGPYEILDTLDMIIGRFAKKNIMNYTLISYS